MTAEHRQPDDAYGFTEREKLFDRISDSRFQTILAETQTAIHEISLSANSYGEFLFVATSRPVGQGRAAITFFGLGLHEQRDRLIVDEWFWYDSSLTPERMSHNVDRETAQDIIRDRRHDVDISAAGHVQSRRGRLFEMLADLTDDDGAIADFDEFEALLDDDDF
ncbi:MAG: hypothetical protein KC519_16810 [Anaerolineae bacterium]|nr:hypothetical protein [Anaerolineae bacterium]